MSVRSPSGTVGLGDGEALEEPSAATGGPGAVAASASAVHGPGSAPRPDPAPAAAAGAEVWRRWRRAAWLVAALSAGVLFLDGSNVVSVEVEQLVSLVGFVLAAGVAAVSCSVRARKSVGRPRLAWSLFALGATCWTVGNGLAFYYLWIVGELPLPGWSDLFYIAALPAVIAGMLVLPRSAQTAESALRNLIDGVIVATSLFVLSWAFVLGPLYGVAGISGLYRVVLLIPPAADVVIVTLAVIIGFRGDRTSRLAVLLLAAGLAAYAVSDTGFAYVGAQGTYTPGTLLDGGWIIGYLLIALAAYVPHRGVRAAGGRSSSSALLELLPYPVAVGTLVYVLLAERRDNVLIVSAVALLLVLVVRQLLSISQNVLLTRTLEARVAERAADAERLSRQLDSILNSAGDGIYGVDTSGRITFANASADRLLGRDSTGLLGTHRRDLVAAPADPTYRDADVRYRRSNGSDFVIESTETPFVTGGQVVGSIVVFRDITERRALEEMKDEFISVVSHELRTPLTSVRGALGLLSGGVLGAMPAKAQRMIDVAVESTERLIRLINDILDVERMTAGKLVMMSRACLAADLVGDALRELKPYADGAGVTLVATRIEGTVWADPDRLIQTLTNLLSNAIKFSPRSARVEVSAQLQDGFVLFRVRDQGRGIPADQLEQIFGRFQQVDSSDSRDKGGTGLGLAICRGIVEQHGGRIWADSATGGGATMSFTIPATIPEATAPATPPPSTAARLTVGTSVLICDDDPAVRAVLGALLESHGYEVLSADSGAQALLLAAAHRPSVILLDLLMPGLSGWQTAAALKQQASTASIPIVILSVLRPDEAASPEAIAGWLAKPLDEAAMFTLLKHTVDTPESPPRVLVVEDDPALGQVLTTMFDSRGLETILATTEYDAVRLAKTLLPQLVVLDLNLPDGDGFAVVNSLRQDDQLRAVSLVVYTAQDLTENDRQRLRLGETRFLTKSVTPPQQLEEQVVGLVRQMTGTHS